MTEHLIILGADEQETRWQCSCNARGAAPDQDTAERSAERHVPAGAPVRWKTAR